MERQLEANRLSCERAMLFRITGSRAPVDQRHVVASLWMDPWVLSFDWATTEVEADYFGPTPEMIDMLESLRFHPACFAAMRTGETWSP